LARQPDPAELVEEDASETEPVPDAASHVGQSAVAETIAQPSDRQADSKVAAVQSDILIQKEQDVVPLGDFHPARFEPADAKARQALEQAVGRVADLGPAPDSVSVDAVHKELASPSGESRMIVDCNIRTVHDGTTDDTVQRPTVQVTLQRTDSNPDDPKAQRSVCFTNGQVVREGTLSVNDCLDIIRAVCPPERTDLVSTWAQKATQMAALPMPENAVRVDKAAALLDIASDLNLPRTELFAMEQEFDAGGANIRYVSRVPDAAYAAKHPDVVKQDLTVDTGSERYISRVYNDAPDHTLMTTVVPTEAARRDLAAQGLPAVTAATWERLSPEDQRATMWASSANMTARFTGVLNDVVERHTGTRPGQQRQTNLQPRSDYD
jgi:hypothetical protein